MGGKWQGVVSKDQFKPGDLCEVYLQDALLPKIERFSFTEKYNWRIRMQRLRGVPSECLIVPLTISGEAGQNITKIMQVTKYEKPISPEMTTESSGSFPSFIPKTDEVLFQAALNRVHALYGRPFCATVKADGCSATAYWKNDHFGVCSHTLEKKRSDVNTLWRIAKTYDLEQKLAGRNIAVQWETVGPGIQKNRLGLSKIEPRLFDAYDIDKHEYFAPADLFKLANEIQMPTVDLIEIGNIFNMTEDELRKYAEGKYSSGHQREGVVIRSCENLRVRSSRLSFKVLNLLYKD